MNDHVNPVFAGILNNLAEQPQQVLRAVVETEYRRRLEVADWTYEFSDDNASYLRGRDFFNELRVMQRAVDPSGVLWREHLRTHLADTFCVPMPQDYTQQAAA